MHASTCFLRFNKSCFNKYDLTIKRDLRFRRKVYIWNIFGFSRSCSPRQPLNTPFKNLSTMALDVYYKNILKAILSTGSTL